MRYFFCVFCFSSTASQAVVLKGTSFVFCYSYRSLTCSLIVSVKIRKISYQVSLQGSNFHRTWTFRATAARQNEWAYTRYVSFVVHFLMVLELFSLYILFSHFRPRDATQGNSFFQLSSYARANVRITNETNKRQIPMRASRDLKWENKTCNLKRSI